LQMKRRPEAEEVKQLNNKILKARGTKDRQRRRIPRIARKVRTRTREEGKTAEKQAEGQKREEEEERRKRAIRRLKMARRRIRTHTQLMMRVPKRTMERRMRDNCQKTKASFSHGTSLNGWGGKGAEFNWGREWRDGKGIHPSHYGFRREFTRQRWCWIWKWSWACLWLGARNGRG
jgi:hypothetical protein